jgi:hypothetical protein
MSEIIEEVLQESAQEALHELRLTGNEFYREER